MTPTNGPNPLVALAMSPTTSNNPSRSSGNWFEAFAEAWGKALDTQADTITAQADVVSQGGDRPSDITKLTAESMRMSFMANSSHTSLDSVSKALETMARKG